MIRTKMTDVTENKPIAIMAWDPSITAWGWVIFDLDKNVLDAGCIKTAPSNKKERIRKSDDRFRRITEFNLIFIELIKKHNVQLIVSEAQHGSQSAIAATMLGITIGMSQTLADCLDISLETWSEGDSKLHLLGKRSAGKQETIDAVAKLFKIKWRKVKYWDEAVADAASIFNCALKTSQTLRFLKK